MMPTFVSFTKTDSEIKQSDLARGSPSCPLRFLPVFCRDLVRMDITGCVGIEFEPNESSLECPMEAYEIYRNSEQLGTVECKPRLGIMWE